MLVLKGDEALVVNIEGCEQLCHMPCARGLEMQGEAPCGYVAHTKLKAMGGGGCCSRGLRNRFASFFAPVGAHIGFLSY